MTIDKLENICINDELKSIYEYDECTLFELLCKFYEVISDMNEKITLLENMVNDLNKGSGNIDI